MGAEALLLATVLLAQAASRQEKPAPEPYPWELRARDALYGYLSEGLFREPIGVFFEPAARELYVADSKNSRVGIFDAEGTPVFSFGGSAVLLEPKSVLADADGTIYVLDAGRTELLRFNYRGEAEAPLRFPCPVEGDEAPRPLAISAAAIDSKGRWVIADRDQNRVRFYTRELVFDGELTPPPDHESFDLVADLAVSPDGLIAVCDQRGVPAIHVYGPDGKRLAAFGQHDIGLDNFTAPIAVTFDERGYLYAVDLLRHDVKIFTPEGRFVSRFGGWFSPQTRGHAPGELLYPTDIAVEPGGAVFVAERFGQRVQVFAREPRIDRGGARAPR